MQWKLMARTAENTHGISPDFRWVLYQGEGTDVEDFTAAVVSFLAFHPKHVDLAQRL